MFRGVSTLLKMNELRELIKLVDQSSITEFNIKYEGFKVSMKKGTSETIPSGQQVIEEAAQHAVTPVFQELKIAQPVPEETKPEEEKGYTNKEGLHKIVSPMVGTFYSASSPDTEAYVKAGDPVSDTTVVCIVEAMKLMNEIEAEVQGTIAEVLVENGQLVEYGQPLFLVKPE